MLKHQSRLIVCGTARNVERKIEDFLKLVQVTFLGFLDLRVVICESFSSDLTLQKLAELKRKYEFLEYFKDESNLNIESPRTMRIASARNSVQDFVRSKYGHFDLVAMMDVDGVNRDLTAKKIDSLFASKDWDVATANQRLRYFDIWALRAQGWVEYDCGLVYQDLRKTMSHKAAWKQAVTSKARMISPKASPIEVESAFGGFALYKMEVFLAGRYSGVTEDGYEICEHVPFHQMIRARGYKIFIIPSLINLNFRTQVMGIVKAWVRGVVLFANKQIDSL